MPNLSISDGLYLLHKRLSETAAVSLTEIPTDHIVIIDCSGSMSYELPKIRAQLKNKLPMMMKEGDTVSIVWFSGKREFGMVIEGVELRSAVDLTGVHRAIDNYLKPVGLTGFVEPMRETAALIGRLQKPGRAINLFFMSDGHDNQWQQAEILKMADELNPLVSSAAVVEYGYYCNKPLMVKIAERLGASEVLSANFTQYEPIFESAMTKRMVGIKKLDVKLDTQAKHGFAFTTTDNEIVTFAVNGESVSVPEGTRDIYWFAELPPSANFVSMGEVNQATFRDKESVLLPLYAGLVPLSQRMLSTDIFRALKATGDVRLIEQFGNCFGKQAYQEFQVEAQAAAFVPAKRLTAGYDPNKVPAEDAFTLIDLLYLLQGDDGNLFYPGHPAFDYDRIGRKAVTSEILTEAEETRIAEIAALIGSTRDPAKLRELQRELGELTAEKAGLKFVYEDEHAGYPINNLVFNEDRPNISAQVAIKGTIDLASVLDESLFKKDGSTYIAESGMAGAGMPFPVEFPTGIYRNFTVIRDGIRNVDFLPVTLTAETRAKLVEKGVVINTDYARKGWPQIDLIDLTRLPLINRKMVKEVSAKELFERSYELAVAKAAQKVFNHYSKEMLPPAASRGLGDLYGTDVGAWLAGMGIKDYGYSPKVTLTPPTEAYMSKELAVALAGISSIPSVNDVLKKMDASGPLPNTKKALTPREALLETAINEVRGFLTSPAYASLSEPARQQLLAVWLSNRTSDTTKKARKLMRDIAQTKFAIIVGQVWFREFASLDENSLDMKFGDQTIKATANLREVEVKI